MPDLVLEMFLVLHLQPIYDVFAKADYDPRLLFTSSIASSPAWYKVRLTQAFWPGARGNVSMVCMTFAGTVERLCNSSVKPFTSSGLGSSPVTWDRGWWHSASDTWRKQRRNMGNVGKCCKKSWRCSSSFHWYRLKWLTEEAMIFLANWSILGPVVIHVMKGWHLPTHRSWGKYHWRILWEALWSFNTAKITTFKR